VIVLIPAYEPDARLVDLVERVLAERPEMHLLIVDDGSGPAYAPIFDRCASLGCTVIGQAPNRGKGHALKQGFAYARTWFPGHDVVCADCDGQHQVHDIARVADEVRARRGTIVLGARRFTGAVPAASRIGNTATRVLFARATGVRICDTQTGLRGYAAATLPWLERVPGNRFEYELDVLLHATEAGMSIHDTPIDTVYLDANASSHFRPLVDSARVYAPLVTFVASSLVAFGVDVALLLGVMAATGDLLTSVVVARSVSSAVNFAANRRIVFRGRPGRSLRDAAVRYFALVAAVLVANYALLALLHGPLRQPLLVAKLGTEATVFGASYQLQKHLVFGRGRRHRPTPDEESSAPGASEALMAGSVLSTGTVTHERSRLPNGTCA
jgi:putative flippase GtrA